MSLTIVEIIKQADQGLSSPFLCRGDDGRLYFVKGKASGRASLWAEWLGGHLGRAFGLPIPPFCIADVPAALIPSGRKLAIMCLPNGAGKTTSRIFPPISILSPRILWRHLVRPLSSGERNEPSCLPLRGRSVSPMRRLGNSPMSASSCCVRKPAISASVCRTIDGLDVSRSSSDASTARFMSAPSNFSSKSWNGLPNT